MASRSSRHDKKTSKKEASNVYVTKHGAIIKEEVVVKKKRRLKVFNIFLFLVILLLLYLGCYFALKINITNIYVVNNSILSDQKIIEEVKISNYPSIIKNNSYVIEKRLKKNKYIIDADVSVKWLTQVHINIEENTPLFYNVSLEETVLKDGSTTKDIFNVPVLINYIPDTIYEEFIKEFSKLDDSIKVKISEIKYDPNDVDEERIHLTMTDGNYVYLTLDKFDAVNSYISIIKNFSNKKGTLYLDEGEYFKVN